MKSKIAGNVFLTLIILNGLFFMCNIYVLGNREEIIKMHQDLLPAASDVLANAKVIGVFITGILYIATAVGIIRKKFKLALIEIIIGFIINSGLYIVQLVMWADIHPRIWIHFALFGGINLIYCIYAWLSWKNNRVFSSSRKPFNNL